MSKTLTIFDFYKENIMHQVIKNVVAIRKELDLSQEEVAEKLGMYQQKYSRFEGAAAKIDFTLLERLAKEVFKMDVDEVINWHKKNKYPKSEKEEVLTQELKEDNEKYVTFSTLDLILNSKNETIQALKKALTDKEDLIKLLKSKLSN